MSKRICVVLFLFLFSALYAEKEPMEVKIGCYITDIYLLDWKESTYDMNFWVWLISDQEDFLPSNRLDVVNALTIKFDSTYKEPLPDGKWWSTSKVSATLEQDWDLEDFPFVSQKLFFSIEDIQYDASQLNYVIDKESSKIDPDLILPGWIISGFEITSQTKEYDTNFGDYGREGKSTYDRVDVTVTLERKSAKIFFQMFGIMYVAFFLSICVFFIPSRELNPKMGLLTAAIFAAIGNKFVLDTYLPTVGELTLADRLQMLTFFSFGVTVVMILAASALYRKGHNRIARGLEIGSALVIFFAYLGITIFWIHQAVTM